jgi:non-heme chloroperoxidase
MMTGATTVEALAGTPSRGSATSRRDAAFFIPARDGTRLFCRDWGEGNPVVFAAPWALGCDWWEYQMAFLADRGLRCVAYDRRGQDHSDQPREGYDFDTLSDDLATIIATLDLRQVTLVAHSMGAAEAVRYLSRHGTARAQRLVLIAPITPGVSKSSQRADGFDPALHAKVRAALATDRPGNIAAAAASFFNSPANTVSSEMMQWWVQLMLRCPLNVMLTLHRAFTEADFTADLAALKSPTLIIHGDKDTSAPLELTGRPSALLISGSRLEIYAGAGHGLPISHMQRLNGDLLTFVRSS